MNAFGLGGTVRTTLNLAGHLAAAGYEVTLLSVIQRADEPFFGKPPPGVELVTLDDRRRPPSLLHPLRRLMWGRSSLLVHPRPARPATSACLPTGAWCGRFAAGPAS